MQKYLMLIILVLPLMAQNIIVPHLDKAGLTKGITRVNVIDGSEEIIDEFTQSIDLLFTNGDKLYVWINDHDNNENYIQIYEKSGRQYKRTKKIDLGFFSGAISKNVYVTDDELFSYTGVNIEIFHLHELKWPKVIVMALSTVEEAWCVDENEIYVEGTPLSSDLDGIFVFANKSALFAKRKIIGDKTQIKSPVDVAVWKDEIFVLCEGEGEVDTILVFDKHAEGNVAPKRKIHGPNTNLSWTLDPSTMRVKNDKIFVVQKMFLGGELVEHVFVFDAQGNGDVKPLYTTPIAGPRLDLFHNNVFAVE